MKRFIIFNDRNEALLEIELPGAGISPSFPIRETQRIGFAVEDPELGDSFRVAIGDKPLSDELSHRLRREIQWEISPCLDGANGVTPITLRNTSDGGVLARANALVEPSKLSLQAYEHMFEAITRISIELLLDLVAKSRLSLGSARRASSQVNATAISARLELGRIRKFWRGFSSILSQVLDSPVTRMDPRIAVRRLRPAERAGPQILRRLATSGRPAKMAVREGLLLALPTVAATTDTHENRVIVGFISLLQQRVLRSRSVAEHEHQALRARLDSHAGSDPDLHKFVVRRESPRLSKLLETIELTDRLAAEMSRAIRHFGIVALQHPQRSFLADLDTSVFRSHPTYARVAMSIRRFLTQTAMVVEQGDDESAKGIETLYEQWVFFETCAALRAAGLSCVSHRSLFEPISRNRFSVDLDRNAAVVFEASDGRRVSVRYEPTILPREAARGIDSLYRGNARTPWTPDIVLELLEPQTGPLDYHLVYAAVIDAKYTQRHNLDHKLDEVSRYQEIRSVATGKQIVRQVWVAAPVDAMIMPRDETVLWSADGEVGADVSDVILGVVGVDPATPEETAATMKSLVLGILNHAHHFAGYHNVSAEM